MLSRATRKLRSSIRTSAILLYRAINNFMLHLSLQKIINTVVAVASSGEGSDKCAAVQSSRTGLTAHCLLSQIFESKLSVRVPKRKLLR